MLMAANYAGLAPAKPMSFAVAQLEMCTQIRHFSLFSQDYCCNAGA